MYRLHEITNIILNDFFGKMPPFALIPLDSLVYFSINCDPALLFQPVPLLKRVLLL